MEKFDIILKKHLSMSFNDADKWITEHPHAYGAIALSMKEAYNLALDDAAEKATAKTEFYGWGKECQLDASEYGSTVNKDSILSLKLT